MNLKNKLSKFLVLLGILALALMALAGCGDDNTVTDERVDATVTQLISKQPQSYVTACFPTADDENVIVDLTFSVNSSRDTIWLALEKLLAGAPNAFVADAIPKGVKLKDLYSIGEVVYIYFTGDVDLTIEDINLEALGGTVNMGLHAQDCIEPVSMKLYFNGEAMTEDVIVVGNMNDYSDGGNMAYVYYSDSQAYYIAPTCLSFDNEVSTVASVEFLDELLSAWASVPPADSGLWQCVAEGIEYQGMTLENEVLTIDFNDGINIYGVGSAQASIFIDSLEATLRSYENVDLVYISCNGEIVNYLPSGADLSTGITIVHALGSYNKIAE